MYMDMSYLLIVGEGCIIGYKVFLYGCMIGDNILIGMGVVILNGVKIGKNCLIGVNVLIMENKVIFDGFLVMGFSGKVVCELDEQGIQGFWVLVLNYQ